MAAAYSLLTGKPRQQAYRPRPATREPSPSELAAKAAEQKLADALRDNARLRAQILAMKQTEAASEQTAALLEEVRQYVLELKSQFESALTKTDAPPAPPPDFSAINAALAMTNSNIEALGARIETTIQAQTKALLSDQPPPATRLDFDVIKDAAGKIIKLKVSKGDAK